MVVLYNGGGVVTYGIKTTPSDGCPLPTFLTGRAQMLHNLCKVDSARVVELTLSVIMHVHHTTKPAWTVLSIRRCHFITSFHLVSIICPYSEAVSILATL